MTSQAIFSESISMTSKVSQSNNRNSNIQDRDAFSNTLDKSTKVESNTVNERNVLGKSKE